MNKICIAAFVLALSGAPLAFGADADWSNAWAVDPIWHDGQAEVSHYASTRSIYGKSRHFETVVIIVREDLDADSRVKADPPYANRDLMPVIKANIVQEIPTENYNHRYMTSVFVEQEAPWKLAKQVVSSQEWCGAGFKEIAPWLQGGLLRFHSYWDGQGDGEYPLDMRPGDLTEEQLVLALRSLDFESLPLSATARILDGQIANKAVKPSWSDSSIHAKSIGKTTVAAGEFDAVEVTLKSEKSIHVPRFVFDANSPHVLLKASFGDGRTLELTKTSRRIYW